MKCLKKEYQPNLDPNKVHAILNGIDTDKYQPNKDEALLNIFKLSNVGQVMIFCNRKTTVTYVTSLISNLNISVGCIHSELTQDDRNLMM